MKPFSLLRRIATIALLMAASSAHADTFPSRPIRLIVPFGPGGITDLIARQAALGMAEKLGQPVIIENKPSAGHIVAMQTVAQATPDGYTILLGSNTGFTVAPHMYKNLPFRIDTLQPIAPINTAPTVLLARPDFPANNLTELIQYIKDNPGKLNYGSFGIGTSAHLGMEIMKSDLGLNIMHIPYRGDAQGLLALKAKEVDIAYITLFSAQARIRAGEFKALGCCRTTASRPFPTSRPPSKSARRTQACRSGSPSSPRPARLTPSCANWKAPRARPAPRPRSWNSCTTTAWSPGIRRTRT